MTSQAVAEEVAQPGAQQLLDSGGLVRVAYVGPDGFPRVVPVGFVWTRGRVVFCTAPSSPKARALAARPEVALSIDAGSTPDQAKSLSIRGVAQLETVDGVPDEYLAMSAKTLPADQLADFEHQVRALYRQMVRISVEPRWARYFDFGAGRLPTFLTKLVQGEESGPDA